MSFLIKKKSKLDDNVSLTSRYKVLDLIKLAMDLGFKLNIYDPVADLDKLEKSLKQYVLKDFPVNKLYDVLLLGVPHKVFREESYERYNSLLNLKGFIFDLKGFLGKKINVVRP